MFRAKYDLAKAFDSAEALHEWNNVVYIHTRRTRRFEYAEAALKAGCHVICDIPLNKNEEAEELQSLANDRGLLYVEYTPIAHILSDTTQRVLERGDLH